MGEQIEATALWIVAQDVVDLRSQPLPKARPDAVLVETLWSGISRGTERLILRGGVPASERDRMRAPHQEGEFPWPVKYGYAAVGRIVEGPGERIGETVFALHPHQDRFVVPSADAVPVPAGIPAARAVLAANMETALNIVWDAGIAPGDRVSVVGAGLVGLLVARLARRIAGTEVTIVDIDADRRAVAVSLGLDFALPGDAEGGRDVVVHASATGAGLATALSLAGEEARIVEASWYGERDIAVSLGAAFHARRLVLASSQVGAIPAARRVRWTNRRRLEKALQLLDDPDLERLVSGETDFSVLAAAYVEILAAPSTLLHRVRYRAAERA